MEEGTSVEVILQLKIRLMLGEQQTILPIVDPLLMLLVFLEVPLEVLPPPLEHHRLLADHLVAGVQVEDQEEGNNTGSINLITYE